MTKTAYSRRVILALWGTIALFLAFCFLFLYVCTDVFDLFFADPAPGYRAAVSLAAFAPPDRKTVVLDAGHGGYDSGARSASGVLEKDLNLAITKKIAAYLSLYDVRVVLTRSGDEPPKNQDNTSRKRAEILSRVKIAEDAEPDLVLSIHMNSFPQEKCAGAQVFYSGCVGRSEVFAATLREALCTLVQPENTRSAKETDSILLLSRLNVPAALLECGFLSNEDEVRLLTDENYQSRLSFAAASAILTFLYPTT